MAALKSVSWRRLLAWLWLGILVAVAALAPYLPLPFQPADPDLKHIAVAPFNSTAHWLGTDAQGRDILANLIFGARTTVLFTLPAAGLAAALGTLAGSTAGFWRNALPLPLFGLLLGAGLIWWALALPFQDLGLILAALAALWMLLAAIWKERRVVSPVWVLPLDSLVLGATALLGAVPRLVVVVVVSGMSLEPAGLLGVLVLTAWPDTARLVRAEMLRVRALPFIAAAQALGIPPSRIWLRHALPHAAQPLRAAFPLSIASLVALESTLSFLGIGLPPTIASWGRMLSAVRLAPEAWWIAASPAAALVITLLSLKTITSAEPEGYHPRPQKRNKIRKY